ncbi:MAG: hypothetical protein AAGM22_27640 [Acidobacteriota bacterium]
MDLKTLVVLVPNYRGKPSSLAPLKEMLRQKTTLKNALWLEFTYAESLCSNKDPEIIAQSLSDTIDNYVYDHRDQVDQIILAGHSMGASILRRAYLNASGFGRSTALSKSWANLVCRLVLMGGFGRGFVINNQSLILKYSLSILAFTARTFGFGKMLLAMLAGSDFISRLRVDWLHMSTSGRNVPQVVHLLGSADLAIRPEDVIDLDQFPNAVPVGVSGVSHSAIARPNQQTENPLKRAFLGEAVANRGVKVTGSAKKVFFFLHGIRDSRDCFKKVSDELSRRYPEAKMVLPHYGYLSARGFLNTRYRNSFVSWFIDEYAEYLARNPKTEFYFAGHSNGTYILGEALQRIPRLSFERLYLAASVLPPKYDWDTAINDRQQAKSVRSDMGSQDWSVGVLCRVLNKFGWKDIGTGGFDGFEFGDTDHIAYHRFTGGHGAMLKEGNTTSIVDFLLSSSSAKLDSREVGRPSKIFVTFVKYGDILLPIGLLLLLAIVLVLATLPLTWPSLAWHDFGPPMAALIVAVLWIVMGRF